MASGEPAGPADGVYDIAIRHARLSLCGYTVTLSPCRARIRVSSPGPVSSGRGLAPARVQGWHAARRWRSSLGCLLAANLRHGALPGETENGA